jgi:hypothetical protein
VEVAKRHDGVAGPGWLLAVAVVRTDERERTADTLELALAGGVALHALGDCVTYVEMAARLFAGQSVEKVVEAATGRPAPTPPAEPPDLCGESIADAVTAGVWAVGQTGGVADVVHALADVAPPGVGAAAAGLVGLRDGGGAVPAHWHRRLHCSAACMALAPGLVRARCRSDAENGVAPPDSLVVRATFSRAGSATPSVFATPFLPQLTAADFLRRPLVGTGVR